MIRVFKNKIYAYNFIQTCISIPGVIFNSISGVISISGGRLGRNLEYCSYARWQTLDLKTTGQDKHFDV